MYVFFLLCIDAAAGFFGVEMGHFNCHMVQQLDLGSVI